jgi:signal transduction histidine kinase
VFILQPFSAFFSNFILNLFGYVTIGNFFHSTFSWWFGNVMGQLLFTPFLLLLFNNYKKINLLNLVFYGIVFFAYIYIIQIVISINNSLLLLSLSLPVIIVIMVYKGIVYGALFSVLVAIVSSYSMYLGIGVFSIGSIIDNILNYNLFVLAHISIIFTIGILFEERKRYAMILEETIAKEVKKNQEQQILMFQQSRLAQMGEMISMIAHQWRQPLNNLSLINQLLISKYNKNKLDDEVMNYFKTNSKKQIDLMSSTIDDFRNFFKKENREEEYFINNVIDDVLNITEAVYVSSGIKIEFTAQENYKLFGSANALSQVILNIINNAKDALTESAVKDKKITITVEKHDENIAISLQDNAGGIPLEIIDKIFDPYFSTKNDKNGTGLGLYMSKMILQEQLKGTIEVKNSAVGAHFIIYLPQKKGKK